MMLSNKLLKQIRPKVRQTCSVDEDKKHFLLYLSDVLVVNIQCGEQLLCLIMFKINMNIGILELGGNIKAQVSLKKNTQAIHPISFIYT